MSPAGFVGIELLKVTNMALVSVMSTMVDTVWVIVAACRTTSPAHVSELVHVEPMQAVCKTSHHSLNDKLLSFALGQANQAVNIIVVVAFKSTSSVPYLSASVYLNFI